MSGFINEEDSIQQSCCFWFGLQYPKFRRLLHHSANEGKRTKWQGAKLKNMGMQKGFPDLGLFVPRGGFHGLFIEMKKKDGRLSKEQKEMLQRLADQGYKTAVARSIQDFMKEVTEYMELV